jgi:hypothetical protein
MSAVSKWLRDSVRVYSDATLAASDFSKFFSDMAARGFKPKVQAISQVKLDFAEVDEDPHLREAIEDFKLQQATQPITVSALPLPPIKTTRSFMDIAKISNFVGEKRKASEIIDVLNLKRRKIDLS